MSASLVGVIASTVLLIALAGIFRLEGKRNVRFLAGLRRSFDSLCERTGNVMQKLLTLFGRTVIRQTTRYLFHLLLAFILRLLRRAEQSIQRVYRFNKEQAIRARIKRTQPSIFDEIKEHKDSLTLSEEEKRKRRHTLLE
jgi:hypothetical protein